VPLPPQPEVKLGSELQRLLSQADLELGRLDGSIQTLPNPGLFVLMYAVADAFLKFGADALCPDQQHSAPEFETAVSKSLCI
jgi:hypothetical protein